MARSAYSCTYLRTPHIARHEERPYWLKVESTNVARVVARLYTQRTGSGRGQGTSPNMIQIILVIMVCAFGMQVYNAFHRRIGLLAAIRLNRCERVLFKASIIVFQMSTV